MDGADLDRAESEAAAKRATAYDVLSWEIADYLAACGLLEPPGLAPAGGRFYRTHYAEIVRGRLSTIRKTAEEVVISVPESRRLEILREGYTAWLEFGLRLKAYFKGDDPVFVSAMERTREGIAQIERAQPNLPMDPALLLRRYLMKLLVGLEVADAFAKKNRLRPSEVRVFDTPEYIVGAKLLNSSLGVPMDRFAIPTEDPARSDLIFREILDLGDEERPLFTTELTTLHAACEEVRGRLTTQSPEAIKLDLEEDAGAIAKEVRTRIAGHLGLQLATGQALFGEVAKAIEYAGQVTPPTALAQSLTLMSALWVARREVTSQLAESSRNAPAASLLATRRLILAPGRSAATWKRLWPRLLGLAKTFRHRRATEERVARQVMEPWIADGVWYDPA